MLYWKATMSDDHRIFAYGCGSLYSQINEYLDSHPNAKLKDKKKISKTRYLYHEANKHDPRYWIQYEQGDEIELTDGQIKRLLQLRNIPPPLTGKEEYIAKRIEFEASKPQRPESWSPRLTW